MPFQPGQSGNPGGRGKAKPFRDALSLEMMAAENGDECLALPGSLRWNARQLLEKGDVSAIREIADRLDGKVPQGIVGKDDETPIELRHSIDAERFTRAIAGIASRSGTPEGD